MRRGKFQKSHPCLIFSDLVACRRYCVVVNGERGCCLNGKTCTGDTNTPQCTTSGYVVCPGENFCCRTFTLVPTSCPVLINFFRLQRPDTNAAMTLPVILHALPRMILPRPRPPLPLLPTTLRRRLRLTSHHL